MGLVRTFVGGIVCALAASSAAAKVPAEPLEMAPSSNWVADYAADSCSLRREFKVGDDNATLQIRQFAPGLNFEVAVVTTSLRRVNEAVRVRFEPDETFFEPPNVVRVGEGDVRGIAYRHNLIPTASQPTPELPVYAPDESHETREQAITGLSITGAFERPVLLRTGRMDLAMGAMRACLDDLLVQWGIDPAADRSLTRRPWPINLDEWARKVQSNYPSDMVRTNQSGVVFVRLLVGPDGKPISCFPNEDSVNAAFSEQACETTMQHARFEPALDASGAPTTGFYTTTIVYHLN